MQNDYVSKKKKINIACDIHKLYSVHTVEIRIDIDPNKADYFRRNLDRCCERDNQRSGYRNKWFNAEYRASATKQGYANRYVCYDSGELLGKGISDLCFMESVHINNGNVSVVANRIKFQLNPRILLGYSSDKYIHIMPNGDADMVAPLLTEALKPLGFEWYDLMYADVNRIDLCTNIKLESQDIAEKYLSLLKKGDKTRGLPHRNLQYNKVSHRKKYPDNTVSYTNSLSTKTNYCQELVLYSKYAQMLERANLYDTEEIERARGQIRIELRVKKGKYDYLAKKYGCRTLGDTLGMIGIIGEEVLGEYLKKIYGSGKILSYSKASAMIDKIPNHYEKVKYQMKNIVEETRKGNVENAFLTLNFPNTRKKDYWKYFNEAGFSPITIPDRWRIEAFESPVTYIETRNVNERDLD